jgi:hypothetical protein
VILGCIQRVNLRNRRLYRVIPLANPPKSPFVKGGLAYAVFSPL